MVGFIASPRPDIRLLATENLVPYSTSQPTLFKADNLKPVTHLKLLIKDHPVSKNTVEAGATTILTRHQKIAEHVTTILINLSADREILESLATDDKFLSEVLRQIIVSKGRRLGMTSTC